jgi:hypothetical protein
LPTKVEISNSPVACRFITKALFDVLLGAEAIAAQPDRAAAMMRAFGDQRQRCPMREQWRSPARDTSARCWSTSI